MSKKVNVKEMKGKVKGKAKKVANSMTDGVKIGVALVAALTTAEAGFLGATMLENDAEFAKDCAKHKINPEPVYTKKHFFSKKQVSTINPRNGRVEEYKGNKVPTNKKAIKVK